MTAPVVHQAASLLLCYPGDDWPQRLETVHRAVRHVRGTGSALLAGFCSALRSADPLTLAAQYVATFDRSRRRSLYLTYYTDGDTRRRGASLARLKDHYRDHGWLPPEDELPDFLPLMLEFAARSPEPGLRLLSEHRPAVEVLRHALVAHRSPYADVLQAVCGTLPGPAPASREEALRIARNGPPAETVGLEPFPAQHGHVTRGTRR